MQVWWPSRRQAFSPQFQAYLAATEAPQAITTLADLFGEVGSVNSVLD